MLPDCRSGKISTLARPATGLPGALDAPTSGTSAASSCISPSSSRLGASSRAIRVACCTFSTSACFALPFVEKDSSATRGSPMPHSVRAVSAAATAMWASSSAVGQGMTTQSAYTSRPSSPRLRFGHSIKKLEDTTFMPGFVRMICSAGRSMSPVVCAAPDTSPSASPCLTIMMP